VNAAHSLEEIVAAELAPSVRWMQDKLRRGEIRGRKIGRHWKLTDADLQAYLDATANTHAAPRAEVTHIGLSAASARRRSA
jgi:hypothetical protein